MGVNKMFFSSSKPELDLEIGGVYPNTISNETELASKFNFSVGVVTLFIVDGSDVYSDLTVGNYLINTSAFDSDLNITRIKTSDKTRIINTASFIDCTNLIEISSESNEVAIQDCFRRCTYALPSLFNVPNIDFSTNRMDNMFGGFAVNQPNTEVLDLSNTVEIVNSNNCDSMFGGVSCTVDFSGVTKLDASSVSQAGRGVFSNFFGTVRLWSCTDLQATYSSGGSVFTNVFGQHTQSRTIEINVIQKTINGGNPHADLTNAISNGATVIYTDNNGVPQP